MHRKVAWVLFSTKKNYHLHSGKLEFLAMKWAICEHFRDYLYYAPSFVVFTGNNPLTYVLSTAKLNATGHRWVGELAEFNFTIRYRPGKSNVDADTLTRHTTPSQDESGAGCREQASPSTTEPTATQEYTQHNGEERTIEEEIPPTAEETRPRRVRQLPNRLTYYMPGQACSRNASQVSTSIPVANWWESPERPWIPTPPYTWIPPVQSCLTAQTFPLSPPWFYGMPVVNSYILRRYF